jgi:hypothetical protein
MDNKQIKVAKALHKCSKKHCNLSKERIEMSEKILKLAKDFKNKKVSMNVMKTNLKSFANQADKIIKSKKQIKCELTKCKKQMTNVIDYKQKQNLQRLQQMSTLLK